MASASAEEALEVLELMLVPGSRPPVYAVGMAARRITFADQQRRSLNLVWALVREGRAVPGQHIAIVGAGIAGVTAAAFALRAGLEVTIFEKYDAPFSIQQGSGRWVHPNIYEWPRPGWHIATTDFPCMNWSAGRAGNVIGQLRAEWHEIQRNPSLHWLPGHDVTGIEGAAEQIHIRCQDIVHGPFVACVLAAGYGEEPSYAAIGTKSYWRDDDLHQRPRHGGIVLISGCGDSGLVDALRVAMLDFDHQLLGEVANAIAQDSSAMDELRAIERNSPRFTDGHVLTSAIRAVKFPAASAIVSARLRPNTKVLLNGRADGPLTRAACMINRVAVALLMDLGCIEYIQGGFDATSVTMNGSKFDLTVGTDRITTDDVVVRHGTDSPLNRFPELQTRLQAAKLFLAGYSAGVDRTRVRHWMLLPGGERATLGSVDASNISSRELTALSETLQQRVQQALVRAGVMRVAVSVRNTSLPLVLTLDQEGRTSQLVVDPVHSSAVTYSSTDAAAQRRLDLEGLSVRTKLDNAPLVVDQMLGYIVGGFS